MSQPTSYLQYLHKLVNFALPIFGLKTIASQAAAVKMEPQMANSHLCHCAMLLRMAQEYYHYSRSAHRLLGSGYKLLGWK
jgi:hypothetical protein